MVELDKHQHNGSEIGEGGSSRHQPPKRPGKKPPPEEKESKALRQSRSQALGQSLIHLGPAVGWDRTRALGRDSSAPVEDKAAHPPPCTEAVP